jgi:hypothetical protein
MWFASAWHRLRQQSTILLMDWKRATWQSFPPLSLQHLGFGSGDSIFRSKSQSRSEDYLIGWLTVNDRCWWIRSISQPDNPPKVIEGEWRREEWLGPFCLVCCELRAFDHPGFILNVQNGASMIRRRITWTKSEDNFSWVDRSTFQCQLMTTFCETLTFDPPRSTFCAIKEAFSNIYLHFLRTLPIVAIEPFHMSPVPRGTWVRGQGSRLKPLTLQDSQRTDQTIRVDFSKRFSNSFRPPDDAPPETLPPKPLAAGNKTIYLPAGGK